MKFSMGILLISLTLFSIKGGDAGRVKIFGGQKATKGQFPYQVHIFKKRCVFDYDSNHPFKILIHNDVFS